ncbi:MAG TPA: hypothetical protein VF125_11340 [Solirubrobacterales bacterium]
MSAAILVYASAPASATVLCSKQVTPCGGNVYLAKFQVNASLPTMNTAVLETGLANVTCLQWGFGILTTTSGGSGMSVAGRVNQVTVAECTIPDGSGGTENCNVTVANAGGTEPEWWLANFEKGSKGNGQLSISASSLGPFGLSVLCNAGGSKINCLFTNGMTSAVTGGVAPGSPATITGAEKLKPVMGAKCPGAEATWRFKLEVWKPAAFYLEAE